jgi:hypothetical protein
LDLYGRIDDAEHQRQPGFRCQLSVGSGHPRGV